MQQDLLKLDVELEGNAFNYEAIKLEMDYVQRVLNDYRLAVLSREVSFVGRKEVLSGKAKFGVFGDGNELSQIALAHCIKKGDWRSGYYRDQTLMFAKGISNIEDFFSQLYADSANDPFSGGRQMNAHFATPTIDPLTGEWEDQTKIINVSSDISSTGGQMARALGLALASKKFRELGNTLSSEKFTVNGDEICVCTIGDASTSEGIFWETINAAGVLRVPLAIFIWDNGYGISVPSSLQTTKGSISEVLSGFTLNEDAQGLDIYTCKAWDYPSLCQTFERGIEKMRRSHIPAIFHVQEATQPQGHSTSGSHERYKSKERLDWEKEHDGIAIMRQWILNAGLADDTTLTNIENSARVEVREAKNNAWQRYILPVRNEKKLLVEIHQNLLNSNSIVASVVEKYTKELRELKEIFFTEILRVAEAMYFDLEVNDASSDAKELSNYIARLAAEVKNKYDKHLYSETPRAALKVQEVKPIYSEEKTFKNGYEIINSFFDAIFEKYPNVIAFGEDLGDIGDVNQGFAGLQEKFGKERIYDVGIREWSLIGEGIGLAMRGFRPIAEIQYLDYIYYGLTPLVDDLTCMRYRSNGMQSAPLIVRTRGHRLEGIWHTGSPMGLLVHALRGMYVCVPRNFVQAAGMYHTLLKGDDPAIVIEPLNSYRLKEISPSNIGELTIPLGVPDIICEGTDVTLVTYGSCVKIALEAIEILNKFNISVELIDVQTLLPFDIHHIIVESLKKTNRIVLFDEDVPGGATSYMMREVLEIQKGYTYLDAPPITITAKDHRTPYGTDGDYYSKPNVFDVVKSIRALIRE